MKIIKKNNLSKSEINVAIMLEEDKDFEQLINLLRIYLGIPSKGLHSSNSSVLLSKINNKKLYYSVNFILDRFEFPNNWFNFFLNILIFGVAIKPGTFEIRYYPAEETESGRYPELHLVISEQITKDKIKKALYDSSNLDKNLARLPKLDDLSRITVAKQYQEINELRKTTNKDIAKARNDNDGGKRVADIKYEFNTYLNRSLRKKNQENRIIQLIGLDLK